MHIPAHHITMSDTFQPEVSAGATADAVVVSIPSVRTEAAEAYANHKKALSEAKADTKVSRRKPADAKPAEKKQSTRIASAEIAGTIHPPARVEGRIRAEVANCYPKELAVLLANIKTLKDALSGKEGADQLDTAEKKALAQTKIKAFEETLRTSGLQKHMYRVADDAPAIIAGWLDWVISVVFDLAASNTLNKNRGVIDMKVLLSSRDQDRPSAETGGRNVNDSAVGPFISALPVIAKYDASAEEALMKKRADEERAKKEAAEKAAAGKKDGTPAEPTRATHRRSPGSGTSFETFVLRLINKQAPQLSSEYTSLRTNWRTKAILNKISQEAIVWITRKIIAWLSTDGELTISASKIMAMLRSEQHAADRPQAEIDSLASVLQAVSERVKEHNEATKRNRRARVAILDQERSDVERKALADKKTAEAKLRVKKALAKHLLALADANVEGINAAELTAAAQRAAEEASDAAAKVKAAAALAKAEREKAAEIKAQAAATAAAAASTSVAAAGVGDLI
jgi:hypothetical protein